MDYAIIGSSSQGNAVLIDGTILCDCGVSWKQLKDAAKTVKIVLLTHVHSDHFRISTVKRLSSERPGLRWFGGKHMIEKLLSTGVTAKRIDICEPRIDYLIGDYKITPIPLIHDVDNFGWIIEKDGQRAIYATDTATMGHLDDLGMFDLILIEGNHGEDELQERIAEKELSGEYGHEKRTQVSHLSIEQANEFIVKHLKPLGEYQYIHQHQEREGADAK